MADPQYTDFMPGYLSAVELKLLLGSSKREGTSCSIFTLICFSEATKRILVAEASLMGVPVMGNDSFGESVSILQSLVCVLEMLCWPTASCWKQLAWQSFISQAALCCWGSSCKLTFFVWHCILSPGDCSTVWLGWREGDPLQKFIVPSRAVLIFWSLCSFLARCWIKTSRENGERGVSGVFQRPQPEPLSLTSTSAVAQRLKQQMMVLVLRCFCKTKVDLLPEPTIFLPHF